MIEGADKEVCLIVEKSAADVSEEADPSAADESGITEVKHTPQEVSLHNLSASLSTYPFHLCLPFPVTFYTQYTHTDHFLAIGKINIK